MSEEIQRDLAGISSAIKRASERPAMLPCGEGPIPSYSLHSSASTSSFELVEPPSGSAALCLTTTCRPPGPSAFASQAEAQPPASVTWPLTVPTCLVLVRTRACSWQPGNGSWRSWPIPGTASLGRGTVRYRRMDCRDSPAISALIVDLPASFAFLLCVPDLADFQGVTFDEEDPSLSPLGTCYAAIKLNSPVRGTGAKRPATKRHTPPSMLSNLSVQAPANPQAGPLPGRPQAAVGLG